MKTLFFSLLCLFLCVNIAMADDLSASSRPSLHGASNGTVDLLVTGGTGPYTYSWSGPSGFTADSQDISNLSPGDYCVTVTDAFCGTASLCVNVADSTQVNTGLSLTINQEKFNVYPSPFFDQIKVLLPYRAEWNYSLLSMEGKMMIAGHSDINDDEINLKGLNSLATGAYQIFIDDKNGKYYQRKVIHVVP